MNDTVLEKHEFGAEVGRLLDLVVHSLYSDREIFLRELVANAADATDRRRFEALTDPALSPPTEAKVRIVPDKAARTLLIADDGIGMGRQDLISNLDPIARSGSGVWMLRRGMHGGVSWQTVRPPPPQDDARAPSRSLATMARSNPSSDPSAGNACSRASRRPHNPRNGACPHDGETRRASWCLDNNA